MPGLASTRVALRAFESKNYRLYWTGQVVSVTGTWMQNIAQAWLVLQLSDSPLALGTIASVQFTPMLLFSLFGGVLADRLPKVKVLWVTQLVMATQALVFAILTSTGVINLPLVYVLAGILGLASAVDQPTRQAMLMELVGPENLPNAIALNSIQFNVARIVGPAIGGVAIATLGIAGALYFNSLSFVATIGALALMDKNAFYEMPPRIQGRVLSQLGEGVRYALRTPDIALIVIVLAFMGTFAYNWNVMMPLVAKYLLHAGPSGFGLLMSAMGAGSITAGVGVAFARTPSPRRLFLGGTALAVLLFAMAFSRSWWLTLPFVVGLGMSSMVFQTTASTRLQLLSPPQMRGRIMGIRQLLVAGTTPIGGLTFGFLAELFGVGPAVAIMAVCCSLGIVFGLLYLWILRRLAGPTPDDGGAPGAAGLMPVAGSATATTMSKSL